MPVAMAALAGEVRLAPRPASPEPYNWVQRCRRFHAQPSVRRHCRSRKLPLPLRCRLLQAARAAAKQQVAASFNSIAAGYSEWILDKPMTPGLFEAFEAAVVPALQGRQGAKVRRCS